MILFSLQTAVHSNYIMGSILLFIWIDELCWPNMFPFEWCSCGDVDIILFSWYKLCMKERASSIVYEHIIQWKFISPHLTCKMFIILAHPSTRKSSPNEVCLMLFSSYIVNEQNYTSTMGNENMLITAILFHAKFGPHGHPNRCSIHRKVLFIL